MAQIKTLTSDVDTKLHVHISILNIMAEDIRLTQKMQALVRACHCLPWCLGGKTYERFVGDWLQVEGQGSPSPGRGCSFNEE